MTPTTTLDTTIFFQDYSINSDKFYRTQVFQMNGAWIVGFMWGRRGTRGQVKVERFFAQSDAEEAARKKLYSKQAKGYNNAAHAMGGPALPRFVEEVVTKPIWMDDAAEEPTTDVVAPNAEAISLDLSALVTDLLECQNVTPDIVLRRTTLSSQMEELTKMLTAASATMELVDTIYSRRLA